MSSRELYLLKKLQSNYSDTRNVNILHVTASLLEDTIFYHFFPVYAMFEFTILFK